MPRSVESLKAFMAGSGRNTSRVYPGVVVFGAGKGGVGTSTLAGLTAVHAARRGASVLLVDADETVGTLHLMFGVQEPVAGLGSLRGGTRTVDEVLHEVEPGLMLVPGGGGGVDATLAVASAERRLLLRRVSALYERFDLVLVDGGSRLDSVMAACAVGAGRLLVLTTPNRIAETAAFALVKVARGRFPELPAEVLVNRASEADGRHAHQMVDLAASTFLGEGVPFAGAVPADGELEERMASGGSLAALPESGPAFTAGAVLADSVLARVDAQAGAPAPVIPLHPRAPLGR